MYLVLVVLLVFLLFGGVGYHSGWYAGGFAPYGYGGVSLLGVVLIVLLVLLLLGRL